MDMRRNVVDMNRLHTWRKFSDPDYLREMARLTEENIGAPVREHAERLRAIAARIEYDRNECLDSVCRVHPVESLTWRKVLSQRDALLAALRALFATSKNEMTVRNLPHEWQSDSAMGRAERLLREIEE